MTHTFYRASTVSSAKAIEDLLTRFPGAEITEFVTKTASADDATKGRVQVGTRIFKATLKVSEDFEDAPSEDDGPDEKPEPKSESKPPAEKSEGLSNKPKPPKEDKGDPAGPPDDSADDDPDGGLGEPKISPDEKIVHLLTQILDALGGGAGPGAGLDLDGPGGPPVDVGAPGKGEALPPPLPHHGPGGPGAGPAGHVGPPLPPPAAPGGGAGMAFAAKQFSVKRAGVARLGTRELILEAQKDFPGYKVAHVRRNGEAVVDGYRVDLNKNDLALITLEK